MEGKHFVEGSGRSATNIPTSLGTWNMMDNNCSFTYGDGECHSYVQYSTLHYCQGDDDVRRMEILTRSIDKSLHDPIWIIEEQNLHTKLVFILSVLGCFLACHADQGSLLAFLEIYMEKHLLSPTHGKYLSIATYLHVRQEESLLYIVGNNIISTATWFDGSVAPSAAAAAAGIVRLL